MANVLLVEDDESYRMSLAQLLKREGIKVFESRDGSSGLEILKREHIDLVSLDLAMPKMDGITFYYYLEETLKTHVPVIILTNASHAAYPSNVKEFINKSDVTLEDVVQKIKQHLFNAGKIAHTA